MPEIEIFSVGYQDGSVNLWTKIDGAVQDEPIRLDLNASLSLVRQIISALPEANR
jgi:hypothetical protein